MEGLFGGCMWNGYLVDRYGVLIWWCGASSLLERHGCQNLDCAKEGYAKESVGSSMAVCKSFNL